MTDAPALTRQPETEKAEEPPKRWRYRMLSRVSTRPGRCSHCDARLAAMAPGDEYVSHCPFPTQEEAKARALDIIGCVPPDWFVYLGAFPEPAP
jgi:hypothetical protein